VTPEDWLDMVAQAQYPARYYAYYYDEHERVYDAYYYYDIMMTPKGPGIKGPVEP
jgi:hypothetical protein